MVQKKEVISVSVLGMHDVSLSFGQRLLFKEVSFELSVGQFYLLSGASGSGKTTLLKLLFGLISPDCGSVLLNGKKILGLTVSKRQHLRTSVAFLTQTPLVVPTLSILENVALPLCLLGVALPKAFTQAKDLMSWLDVEFALDQPVTCLSGGERKRLALARAVMCNPQVILADEPLGDMDKQTASHMLTLFERIRAQGITILMSTHNDFLLQNPQYSRLHIQNQHVMSLNMKSQLHPVRGERYVG